MKLKSLAAETKIIRQEEKKAKKHRIALELHRKSVVRTATRSTLLAYSFLRGRAYHQIEHNPGTAPNWKEVERMVVQYGMVWDWTSPKPVFDAAKADELNRFRIWQAIKRE